MIESILSDWSVFGVIAKLLWLVQLALIVHVFKTGRPFWWLWILLIAPVIGGIAYVLVELLPNLSASGGGFTLWKPRAWRIRDLRAELEESDTVKLRLRLAADDEATGQGRASRRRPRVGAGRRHGPQAFFFPSTQAVLTEALV